MANDSGPQWVAYRYDPSMAAAILFCTLFSMLTILHLINLIRTRTWVLIPFLIGGFFEFTGYIGRILSANQTPDWTLGPYIMQTLLLLLAPALFAASIYMVLGRIILVTEGQGHAVVRVKWLTTIFVMGDVVSFLAQSGGGGYMATGKGSNYRTGEDIVIGGLIVQVVVFGFFVLTSALFHTRMLRHPTSKVTNEYVPWQKHMMALYITSILILVRSVFRVVEYAQGNDGYLMSHEWFLFVFDGVLMMGVMITWAFVHPSEMYAMLKGGDRRMVVKVIKVERVDRVGKREIGMQNI